jgi:hypothetical protein
MQMYTKVQIVAYHTFYFFYGYEAAVRYAVTKSAMLDSFKLQYIINLSRSLEYYIS